MHRHNHNCQHDNLKYCHHCSKPYCNDCGQEWGTSYYYTYSQPWNTYTVAGGAGGGYKATNVTSGGYASPMASGSVSGSGGNAGDTVELTTTACKHGGDKE